MATQVQHRKLQHRTPPLVRWRRRPPLTPEEQAIRLAYEAAVVEYRALRTIGALRKLVAARRRAIDAGIFRGCFSERSGSREQLTSARPA